MGTSKYCLTLIKNVFRGGRARNPHAIPSILSSWLVGLGLYILPPIAASAESPISRSRNGPEDKMWKT